MSKVTNPSVHGRRQNHLEPHRDTFESLVNLVGHATKVLMAVALVTTLVAGALARPALALTQGQKGGDVQPSQKKEKEDEKDNGGDRDKGRKDTVVLKWNSVALQAVRDTRMGPPMVARALGIIHTAIYDAWAAYDRVAVGTRLGGALRRPARERSEANKNKAISYASYRALVDLFPSRKADFDLQLNLLGYDPADTTTDVNTPAGIGNVAAAAVLEFRHHDGSNQLGDLTPGQPAYSDYTGYVAVNDPDHINDPNRWQPIRFSNGSGGFVVPKYLGPHWGNVIPFAMSDGALFRPAASPEMYPSLGYYQQAEDLIRISASLTDREKSIAEYWADGPRSETPPGHWCLFAQYVSRRDNHDLESDVKMFFALGNAEMDASIAVWDCKRAYDYVRPVTAIHFLKQGQKIVAWGGPNKGTTIINGEDWSPYQPTTFVTPPFPEYVSGHSTFSAAGAEILKLFTGKDKFGASAVYKAGSSFVEPGVVPSTDVTLSWATFTQAANEAGLSRRYGGIHFEDGDLQGRQLGRLIGRHTWNKALTYFDGTAIN